MCFLFYENHTMRSYIHLGLYIFTFQEEKSGLLQLSESSEDSSNIYVFQVISRDQDMQIQIYLKTKLASLNNSYEFYDFLIYNPHFAMQISTTNQSTIDIAFVSGIKEETSNMENRIMSLTGLYGLHFLNKQNVNSFG